MPGATNPAVSAGDTYEFLCNPTSRKIIVNEKGEVWNKTGKPQKLSAGLSDFNAGEYIEYLECFIVGNNEIVAVFRQSNGEDHNVTIRRKLMSGEKLIWNLSIL